MRYIKRTVLAAGVFFCFFLPAEDFEKSTDKRAGYDWWSLQPLNKGTVPDKKEAHPVDQFIGAVLKKNNLKFSPVADKVTLIRRLSIDLTGLPPTPEEVSSFITDKSPAAYEKLVGRLLASPHYGERWGRHWLDVVHFGESHGFEYNQPRNNSWHYRNWVIDAFNKDMAYDEFVRLQIAGDYLAPDRGGIIATGCLVSGPHNTTKPSNDTMRKTMRQDEMEDIIALVGQTFLGLTVNCARCHDHKFDPISEKDYYSMAALLSGIEFADRDVKVEPKESDLKRKNELTARKTVILKIQNTLYAEAKKKAEKDFNGNKPAGPQPFASWDFTQGLNDEAGNMNVKLLGGARLSPEGIVLDGKKAYAKSSPLTKDIAEKTLEIWVKLSSLDQKGGAGICLQTRNGNVFDAIVFAEKEKNRWMAGSNGFSRTKSFKVIEEKEALKQFVHIAIVYSKNGTIKAYRNGAPYGRAYKAGLQTYNSGDTEIILGLRHGIAAGGGRMLKGTISRAALYDRALSAEDVASSAAANGSFISRKHIMTQMSNEDQKKYEAVGKELQEIDQKLSRINTGKSFKAWAVKPGGQRTTHVLLRGSVLNKGAAIVPRGLPAVKTVSADFKLKNNASDKDRRMKLASWITDPQNPLFSRVMVNRVWHYHFGQGIVTTPNDFGFSGVKPSHPELLDWLAGEFIKHKWSIKRLHRLIVTSKTYKQSSAIQPAAFKKDAGNRLLWRKNPIRIEGEVLRDSMLLMAGKLNRSIGGKGYRDMREYKFKGSHFYDIIEQNKPEQFRRTIYRFSPRGAKRTMLDTFDCPDPSAITPQRAETTTPLQSLALMNNKFVLLMAEYMADRLQKEAGDSPRKQIEFACKIAYGRTAEKADIDLAENFIKEHGLPAYCRIIFNSNEMLYVR